MNFIKKYYISIAASVDKTLFASQEEKEEKILMGLVWRIGSVSIAGALAIALGLNLVFAIVLFLIAIGILFRREALDSLFPLRAYRKKCLSVRGLGSDPDFELRFRKELASVICQALPTPRPTACCCINPGKEN